LFDDTPFGMPQATIKTQSGLVLISREFDEQFLLGQVAPAQQKPPFEGCGASCHSPQTAIIELTLKLDQVDWNDQLWRYWRSPASNNLPVGFYKNLACLIHDHLFLIFAKGALHDFSCTHN
jgi:hypothetical protein